MHKKPVVGIISPGDMGHTVGEVLLGNGLRVFTCLKNRSERTQRLARETGFIELPDYEQLVTEVDLLLSILPPGNALQSAESIARALQHTQADLTYVDCNAVSPNTVKQIAAIITHTGARFVDASIIGPPPRRQGSTRFYASGPHTDQFAVLADYGLEIIELGDQVGRASALKMCYASSTKGFTALLAELMIGAQALGISGALMQEFSQSQPELVARIQRGLPSVPSKARRFVGEMEEIAGMYASLGLTPDIFHGAAEIYRLIGSTGLADRQPEDPNLPDLDDVLQTLVRALPPHERKE